MASNVSKCPACGALREAMSTHCPECGYEFRDSTANAISELNKKFDELRELKLSARDYESQSIDIIKTFPIPHVREELFDVLIYIQPKALDKDSPIRNAWSLRQKEVIERARMAFSNSSKTLSVIDRYESELKKYEKQFVRRGWQRLSAFSKALIIIIVLFILLLLIPAKDTSNEAYAVRFNEAVKKEKLNKALKLIDLCPDMGTMISDDYLTLIDLLVKDERLIEAESLLKNVAQFTSSVDDKQHIKNTKNAIISYYLNKGELGHAQKYADDTETISYIIRQYLDNSDTESALDFYKRNSTKLVKYDATQRKRVIQSDDSLVIEFIKANTYGLK